MASASVSSNKRKLPFQGTTGATNPPASRKRAKTYDARALAVQSTDAALSATGELDAAAFIGAREYEIRALEEGMQRSKTASSSRAFQKVPRALRRRTASHNVKRVPRRLRARAKREMIEDNTPTVTARRRKPTQLLRLRLETARRLQGLNAKTKARRAAYKANRDQKKGQSTDITNSHNTRIAPRVPKIKKGKLSQPYPPDSKFTKRQRGKTWLPTHMFHAKRAHMTPPNEPLWRFALPLNPTEKSYRPTHRAAEARGAVAWDMSYISTIQLEGTPESLGAVLKAIGIEGDNAWGNKGRRWRQGTRSLQAWTCMPNSKRDPIAPVTIIWRAEAEQEDSDMPDIAVESSGTKKKRRKRPRLFIRVHPSAFLQLWDELLSISKKQKPPVLMEDLRFDIGSIEITGPASTEALAATMRPIVAEGKAMSEDSPESVWPSLSGITNPSSLPAGALLAFSISDPRLQYPLQPLRTTLSESTSVIVAKLLSAWPIDKTQTAPLLFDRPARLSATRRLPSQKAINRRRALSGPGKYPLSEPSDPQIPVIALASRSNMNSQGKWTILLPWKCVIPLWYMLMYYPMSSGGIPRFGGVEQQRQLDFEHGAPWFPGDFPGTRAGWQWGIREREKKEKEWKRKPKGRRTEFESVDLGNGCLGEIGRGWACDWERLVEGSQDAEQNRKDDQVDGEFKKTDETGVESKQPRQDHSAPMNMRQLNPEAAKLLIDRGLAITSNIHKFIETPYLMTVRITLLSRGTPSSAARVYRLPYDDDSLRQQWISLASKSKHKTSTLSKQVNIREENGVGEKHTGSQQIEARKQLAASLLSAPQTSNSLASDLHLPIPLEKDLIGFVTSGNYNLLEGKGTGIGSIILSRVLPYNDKSLRKMHISQKLKSGNTTMSKFSRLENDLQKMCIIRSAGERVGRLGFWEPA